MNNIKFQYYPADIETTKPLGFVTINEFIEAIKNPSEKIKDVFELIAKAEKSGDMKTKADLKQNNLFYFTPCISLGSKGVSKEKNGRKYLSYRCYDNIENFTGLAVLDFDHIDYAEEFRDYMFNTYKFISTSLLSSSKRGIKILIKIPEVKSVVEFKEYFYGLGVVFEKYKGFDGSAQNCVLPLFLSYDPNILYRNNPTTFKSKGIKVDAFKDNVKVDLKNIVIKGDDSKTIYNNIEKSFNKIISDGHPQVISSCVSLGGYVGAGYVSESDAQLWASNFIRSNNYLQKGIEGYIKTSKTAIRTGMRSPLILNQ